MTRRQLSKLRTRVGDAIAVRLSPERTRRATQLERLTVRRLDWDQVVKLHRWLELLGKLTTVIWIGVIGTFVLGVDWKQLVEDAVNSGKPVKARSCSRSWCPRSPSSRLAR